MIGWYHCPSFSKLYIFNTCRQLLKVTGNGVRSPVGLALRPSTAGDVKPTEMKETRSKTRSQSAQPQNRAGTDKTFVETTGNKGSILLHAIGVHFNKNKYMSLLYVFINT